MTWTLTLKIWDAAFVPNWCSFGPRISLVFLDIIGIPSNKSQHKMEVSLGGGDNGNIGTIYLVEYDIRVTGGRLFAAKIDKIISDKFGDEEKSLHLMHLLGDALFTHFSQHPRKGLMELLEWHEQTQDKAREQGQEEIRRQMRELLGLD